MRKVNVTDLRQHLPGYLRLVQAGEAVDITLHGKVVARLMPAWESPRDAAGLLARLRASAVIGDVVTPIGEPWEADRDRV